MTELKPCPFCGSAALHGINAYRTGIFIGCSKDCLISPSVELNTEAEAITAWNHRPADESLVRKVLEAAAARADLEWFSGNRHRYASELGPAIVAAIKALNPAEILETK